MPTISAPSKTVVMLSGGIDSVTLSYALRKTCSDLRAVYVDYGQMNSVRGRAMVNRMSVKLNVPVEILNMSNLVKSFTGFLPTPYDEELVIMCETHGYTTQVGMKQQEPQFFAVQSVCATYAMSIGYDCLATGYNKTDLDEDSSRYGNLDQVNKYIAEIMSWGRTTPFEMLMPFSTMSKKEVLTLAKELGIPEEDTWSCWANTAKHCGICPGCYSRKRGYDALGVEDPTVYLDNRKFQ